MKRWMTAALAGLAVVGGLLVAPGSAQASSSAWYQTYRASARGSFFETAAISRNNIWSVGRTHTAAGATIYRPFIRHYDGHSWKAVTIPGAPAFTSDWVSASSANNVWVGGQPKSSRVRSTIVYRWNGTRWLKIPLPAQTGLQGITVLSANNVWAFAASGTVTYSVFHWTGKKWRYYFTNSGTFIPQDISASGPKNVWVTGIRLSGKKQLVTAYRWNGTAWHPVKMPHPANYSGPSLTAVSASNVWIGYDTTSSQKALHWDGAAWHTIAVPNYSDNFNIVPDGKGGYWFGAQASLTGNTWVERQVPDFSGGFGGVTRIPGTTSFLLNAGAAYGDETDAKPTIYRFDL